YRTPLYPFLPAALVIGASTLVIYSLVRRPAESLYGAATVLSGIPLYYVWRKRHILSRGKSGRCASQCFPSRRSRVSYRVRRLVVQRGIERNSDDIGGDVHGTENRT